MAALLLLERLSPEQRAVFVLHDVFAFPAVRLESTAPDLHVAPRPDRELAARRLRTPDRSCDLPKAEPEHLP